MQKLTLFISLIIFSSNVFAQKEALVNQGVADNLNSIEHSIHTSPLLPSWDFVDLFDELERFEEKSMVLQLGIGIGSDIDLNELSVEVNQLDVEPFIPALSITLEKNVWNNLGVGLTLGGRVWEVPIFDYQYRYYIGSLRSAYHFNIMDKLDPYIGASATFRYLELTNTETKINNTKLTASMLVGARYYLTERLGGFIEIGNDALSIFKTGLVFYMP
jgi:hypothetical protein